MNAYDQAEESIGNVFTSLKAKFPDDDDAQIYRTIAIATRAILDEVLEGESLYCIAHRHQCCPECMNGYVERSAGGCAE